MTPAPRLDAPLSHLLRRVRALELVARRNVSSLLAGNYRTTIPGRGLELYEARRYVQGESVRHIDWKVTARLGEPWVRRYVEEREREVFVALDVSPSMHCGWHQRTKLETAVEVAATIAVSAVEAGDRIGYVIFADRALEVSPPQRGATQLFRALKAFVTFRDRAPDRCPLSDPRAAIHAIQQLGGRRFVVFLISDFMDHDVPEDLAYIRLRHDVSLLHVYDPLEYAAGAEVRLVVHSPEGLPGHMAMRLGSTGSLEEMTGFLRREAASRRIAVHSLSTGDPVGRSLAAFFHRRRLEPR